MSKVKETKKIVYEKYKRTNSKTLVIYITKEHCENFSELTVDNFIFEINKKTNSASSTGVATITKSYEVASMLNEDGTTTPTNGALTISCNKSIWSSNAKNNAFSLYVIDDVDSVIDGSSIDGELTPVNVGTDIL